MTNKPTVESIDVTKAREELKSCTKAVRDYVRALENSITGWENVNSLALKKIRELSNELAQYKKEEHGE